MNETWLEAYQRALKDRDDRIEALSARLAEAEAERDHWRRIANDLQETADRAAVTADADLNGAVKP